MTAAAHQTLLASVERGNGDKSFLATIETLEANADTTVPDSEFGDGVVTRF